MAVESRAVSALICAVDVRLSFLRRSDALLARSYIYIHIYIIYMYIYKYGRIFIYVYLYTYIFSSLSLPYMSS